MKKKKKEKKIVVKKIKSEQKIENKTPLTKEEIEILKKSEWGKVIIG